MQEEVTYPIQVDEIEHSIHQLKQNIENNMFWRINHSIVTRISQDAFPAPLNCQLIGSQRKQKEDEQETASTQDSSNSAAPLQSRRAAQDSDADVISHQIAQGDRKTQMILYSLTTFEENCIISKVVCSKKLKILRSYSRRYLGRILNNYETIKSQQSDALALAILLVSASKIGLTKSQFITNVRNIARRKNVCVDSIKQTKSYALVKQLI